MTPALEAIAKYYERVPKRGPGTLGTFLRDDTKRVLEKVVTSDLHHIVEIGSWLGCSALHMATLAPEAHIWCLDTWLGSFEIFWKYECRDLLAEAYERFIANTVGLADRIHGVRMDSINGVLLLAQAGLEPDLVFLDGGHQYQSVRADLAAIEEAFGKVPIVLDDWDHETVQRAAWERGREIEAFGVAAVMR